MVNGCDFSVLRTRALDFVGFHSYPKWPLQGPSTCLSIGKDSTGSPDWPAARGNSKWAQPIYCDLPALNVLGTSLFAWSFPYTGRDSDMQCERGALGQGAFGILALRP